MLGPEAAWPSMIGTAASPGTATLRHLVVVGEVAFDRLHDDGVDAEDLVEQLDPKPFITAITTTSVGGEYRSENPAITEMKRRGRIAGGITRTTRRAVSPSFAAVSASVRLRQCWRPAC